MGLQEMKRYIDLCKLGQASIPERKVILAEKRKDLEAEMKRIQDSMAYIDWKQGFYDDVLSGKIQYVSNLISTEE